jgi:putative component of membrane protein insertase Oxa1/YidC/SpoIIIJ protein YidD
MRIFAAHAIGAYQRYISPHKGFRCAYSVLHQRASCSQFAKRVVLRVGVWRLPALLRRRFAACRSAHLVLATTLPSANDAPGKEPPQDDPGYYCKYCAADAAFSAACCAFSP